MIEVRNLKKDYGAGRTVVHALRGLGFGVARGEFVSIVGPSGCGKSTLLYIIGGMLRASDGLVNIDGFELTGAGDSELTAFRREHIGFVFQKFNLISSLNVYDNLKIACDILKRKDGIRERIENVLDSVGVAHKRKMKPFELSQGEQQRVAIARALVKQPKVLLADEPTGNLDSENSENIVRMFGEVTEKNRQTVVMITHNRALAAMTDRIIEIKDGRTLKPDVADVGAAAVSTGLDGATIEGKP